MTTRILFCLLLILTTAGTAEAQNRFFSEHENGIVLTAGWLDQDDVEGLGLDATLTLDGRFDMGVAYARPRQQVPVAPNLTTEVAWDEITPHAGYRLRRATDDLPLGVDATAGYTIVRFGGSNQDLLGGDALTGGLDVFARLGGEKTVVAYPTLSLGYARATAWARNRPTDPKIETSTSGALIGLELAIVVDEKFLLRPGLTNFDGDTTYAFLAGFALSLEPWQEVKYGN